MQFFVACPVGKCFSLVALDPSQAPVLHVFKYIMGSIKDCLVPSTGYQEDLLLREKLKTEDANLVRLQAPDRG